MRAHPVLGLLLVACAGAARTSGENQEPAGTDEQAPASAVEAAALSVPTDWVAVEAHCGYAFRAPPDLMVQAVGAIDSCADGWATSNCVYRGDYGGFSSDLREYQEEGMQYEETRESIDGHAAKVVTAVLNELLVAAVHFPQVKRQAEGVRLTVWADCQDVRGQQDALRSFRTITFVP